MKVINMRGLTSLPKNVVRVDRRSQWGNPFIMHDESMREEVIEKYRQHLWLKMKDPTLGPTLVQDLLELSGSDLACWCAPKPCHADVMIRAIAWLQENEVTRKA